VALPESAASSEQATVPLINAIERIAMQVK
jgi:hypothetical protein